MIVWWRSFSVSLWSRNDGSVKLKGAPQPGRWLCEGQDKNERGARTRLAGRGKSGKAGKMNVVDLRIEEILENDGSYFRMTIQAGAIKIQGNFQERSLIYLIRGIPVTMKNVDVNGRVKPKGHKRRVEIDSESLALRKVEQNDDKAYGV